MSLKTKIKKSNTMKNQFGNLAVNMSALAKEDKLDGKDYLVFPVILAKECVMNGLLYPSEELSKTAVAWNGRVAVVFHPTDENGTPICANQKQVIENQTVGLLLNMAYETDTTKLKGELWLEKAKVPKVSSRLQELIDNGSNVDVSTGLYLDVIEKEGEFDGKKYRGIATNFRPDHLALLPDGKGACTWEEGAGFPRTNSMSTVEIIQSYLDQTAVTVNEMSHDELRRGLCNLLPQNGDKSWCYLRDVYDGYFIYEQNEPGGCACLFKQGYAVDAKEELSLVGEPIEVIMKTEYEPVANKEQITMDRKKVIDGLITNKHFDETDRTFLDNLTDDQLKKVDTASQKKADTVETPKTNCQGQEADPAADHTPKTETEPKIEVNAMDADREQFGKVLYERERKQHISTIKTNESNSFSDEQLDVMPLAVLENIARLAAPINMQGAAGSPVANAKKTMEVLETPSFDTKK